MDETRYATGAELWQLIQTGHHTHDSELLKWRCDQNAEKGEVFAMSQVPRATYGISVALDGSPQPWKLRCLVDQSTEATAFETLGDAMRYADGKETELRSEFAKLLPAPR